MKQTKHIPQCRYCIIKGYEVYKYPWLTKIENGIYTCPQCSTKSILNFHGKLISINK